MSPATAGLRRDGATRSRPCSQLTLAAVVVPVARALLRCRREMSQTARRPIHNFIAAACVLIGMHAGVFVHSLVATPTPSVSIGPVYVTTPAPTVREATDTTAAVHCRTRNRCTIDRAALLRESMPFARGTKLVPVSDGLRLEGATGLLARLDLRDGDVVQSIDGRAVRDGADLEAAIARLGERGFTFTLRRGERHVRKRIDFVRPAVRVSV